MKIIMEDRFGWPIEVLVEDFKTARAAFEKQGADKEEVKKVLELFKKLRDEQKIKGTEEKNIDLWAKKSFEELKAFVDEVSGEVTKSQAVKLQKKQKEKDIGLPKMKGAELVAQNKGWLVYKITDHRASVVYGVPKSSEYQGWCISNTNPEHWNNYSKDSSFYFYIRKNKERDDYDKIAARVTADSVTFFDMQDTELDEFPAENEPNVDFEEPEIKIEVNDKLMTLSEFENSKNLKVGGDLILSGTPITSLPDGLKVGGDLYLFGTKIKDKDIPEHLKKKVRR